LTVIAPLSMNWKYMFVLLHSLLVKGIGNNGSFVMTFSNHWL